MSSTEEDKPDLSHQRGARALLRSLGLQARKGLGQHFLVDTSVLARIVSAAELASQDTVLEVGPGLGILTQELARQAGRVVAVELDKGLAAYLREALAVRANVTVIQADILKTEPQALLQTPEMGTREGGPRPSTLDPRPYKVVADLPYYITSPVLRHFLEAAHKPSLMVVMVQREVARRILARRGEMSLLALGVQVYGRPSMVGLVSRRSFHPMPRVDSAILRIDVYRRPAVEVDPEAFFRVARAGFGQPRKQLRNALAHGLGLSSQEALALLAEKDIDPHLRAEDLSIEQWERLAHAVGDVAESLGKSQPAR